MEGPTPVSALIHAATMVTAGVFLILRCSSLFEFSHFAALILLFVGGLTAFISGMIGVVQFDVKKVIAYSTCSQLGYMILACGASNFFVSFFHLMNHAFFKALLFLCAGCIIHSYLGEQDFRVMGGLVKQLPVVFFLMFVGGLTLGGFMFLTGFYSKDFILEQLLFITATYNVSFI
jgi:NADH-ubiquinone oxidoreductase chain 5